MPLTLKMLLIGLFVLLGACSSAPINYHTLTPAQPASTARGPAGVEILLERVTVPAQVDRSQIVIREGNSGLVILETEWWGASLSEEIQTALIDQLNARPSSSAAAPQKTVLRVDFQRFDSIPGQYALLDAKWRLRNSAASTTAGQTACRTIVQTPAGTSIDELVAAHQVNLQKLAAAIVSTSQGGRCPAQ
ncbi:PqiC family protein [Pseudomonas sp. LS44]|uniref:PqiC family protein n=1 Tax=Pseudomonas sp. LS44 TaxID=1357074 RepID=UPI00215B6C0E|nr:PqiC family protein [Pseudomonas sp. LS44]UVE17313.1 PqiC family protein [Pseudomonas sp. LS44]